MKARLVLVCIPAMLGLPYAQAADSSPQAILFTQADGPDVAGRAQDSERNVYLIDAMYEDIGDHWQMIGRARIGMSHWGAYDPWRPISEIVIEPSKAGHMVHGLERRGLRLPLPEAVRFRVWSETGYLWVVLGDSDGRRVSSIIPIGGLQPRRWCEVELPLADTAPMGVGAEPIRDLDLVAFLTRESSGEVAERPVHLGFRNLQAIYPKGVGPTNLVVTRESLEATLTPLGPAIEEIDRLLDQAREKRIDVRYPTVSRTVLERYRGEVFSMIHPMDPLVADRTARFLLECADRTRAELRTILDDPTRVPALPDVALTSLHVRDGTFHSGDRPVILAGLVGWFDPGYFAQLSSMGYTCLSMEIGPMHTLPTADTTKPAAVDQTRSLLDTAAQHNMVCDLLVSPHYFPGWAREKWPSTDATGWRQRTNTFMPWTITDPHFREVVARHLAVLIPLVREHPALLSYDLVNEMWYRLLPDFPADQYAEFRRQRPDLDEWQALSQLVTDNITDFVRWYMEEIHQHDRTRPVHIKVIDTVDVLSVDREAIGEYLTASGMDAMPSFPDWSQRLGADFAWPFLRHDFHRTLHPDKPIMDGEYHISGGLWDTPTHYFRSALWGLALHGRDMDSVWSYDRVDDVSIYWHANGVEALGRCALDFIRLAPEIHAFQRQRSPLAMYYGGTQTSDAYRACLFQDLDVGILTDPQIRAGRLDDYRLLVVPFGSDLPADVRSRLQAFRRAGGRVVRCPNNEPDRRLWQTVRRAVDRLDLPRPVQAGRWGVECRAVTLAGRRLLYLLNHQRRPVAVACQSDWPLAAAVDLITGERLDAGRLTLQPLELRMIEVK